MAQLYRDIQLGTVWEGSGNVIALDVLRALAREPRVRGGVPGRVRARGRRRPPLRRPPARRCASACWSRPPRRRRQNGAPGGSSRTWRWRCRHRCCCATHPRSCPRPSAPGVWSTAASPSATSHGPSTARRSSRGHWRSSSTRSTCCRRSDDRPLDAALERPSRALRPGARTRAPLRGGCCAVHVTAARAVRPGLAGRGRPRRPRVRCRRGRHGNGPAGRLAGDPGVRAGADGRGGGHRGALPGGDRARQRGRARDDRPRLRTEPGPFLPRTIELGDYLGSATTGPSSRWPASGSAWKAGRRSAPSAPTPTIAARGLRPG